MGGPEAQDTTSARSGGTVLATTRQPSLDPVPSSTPIGETILSLIVPGLAETDPPPVSRAAGFMGSVKVLTESGWLEISIIVRKCLPARVACSDPDTGRIGYRPITDWSCRLGDPRDLVLLETFAR